MTHPVVDRRMLEALICPQTQGPLRYDAQRQELVSRMAGVAYPVRDGIPVMLVDEARMLEDARPGDAAGVLNED